MSNIPAIGNTPGGAGRGTTVLPSCLPGEIWGVTAFFNSSGNPVLLDNLDRFAASVRRQGLRLLVVELAFGDAAFQVPPSWCDRLVQRRSETVLWQKERLLNLGVDHLPPACDKVVWLDGDIVFENDDWVGETAARLESYAVVQPFDVACWLARHAADPPADPPRGLGEGMAMPGMAAVMAGRDDWRRALADYFEHGHPGFAWAARRDILARHRLYDRHVLGGGDVSVAHAFYGDNDYWRGLNYCCRGMARAELAAMAAWGRALYADVQASVSHVPGRALHLWHGAIAGRGYRDRWGILKDADFDPATDVALDENGCLRWNSDKPMLHRRVRDYFDRRVASMADQGAS